MSVSHWRRALRRPGETRCDVAVVGAGICGVCAALHLERRGLSVQVLERHTIGAGASSRNAGFLMRGAADHYADAARLFGRETARTLWRWTEENLAGLRQDGIEALPSYQRTPSSLLALSEEQAGELRVARGMMIEDGLDAPWQEHGEDTAWRSGRVLGALVNPADAAVNPVDLLRFLSGKLKEPVHEGEEVFGVADMPGGRVRVETSGGRYVADRVLVCTNAYGPLLFPQLAALITARRGQMLAISAEGSARVRLEASYYANHGSEYFRKAADGTVVVGGCRTHHAEREVGYDEQPTGYVQHDIEQFADAVLGRDLPATWRETAITARWAGTMGFSRDGLPLIGPVPGGSERVWFCGAFTGHGMSMAWRAAKEAVEGMLDGRAVGFPIGRFASREGDRIVRGAGM